MNTKELAALADRLERDEAFQYVMQKIREKHMSVFLNGAADSEAVLEAHRMIRALSEIDGQLRRMKAGKAIEDKKES